jgi:hypothetical protein
MEFMKKNWHLEKFIFLKTGDELKTSFQVEAEWVPRLTALRHFV